MTDATRVVAVMAADQPVPERLTLLIAALRQSGVDVAPLALPASALAPPRDAAPSLSELKRGLTDFVGDVLEGLRGGVGQQSAPAPAMSEPTIEDRLRAVTGKVDAVVATESAIARAAFDAAETVWPSAVKVAVDGDFHLDPAWAMVTYDDLVVPHPGVAESADRVSRGVARVRAGGPIVSEGNAKTLPSGKPQVVVSFARLEPGDVDQLLFQISLAHPENFELLFLPSGRANIDELVSSRAAGYGLQGRRTKSGRATDPWIRGASLLAGHPSPRESALAVTAKVPQLIYQTARLTSGDEFLVRHGVALHAQIPITVAVHVEGLLPGGADRGRVEASLAELDTAGVGGAAAAVVGAALDGRPTPGVSTNATIDAGDDDLEVIGGPSSAAASRPTAIPMSMRRAYLKEIILRQNQVKKSLTSAHGGVATWERRVQLAQTSGNHELAAKAAQRVDGLKRVLARLQEDYAALSVLRERFASKAPISESDRALATRFIAPERANQLDRGVAPDTAFTRLELDDALQKLKDKMFGG